MTTRRQFIFTLVPAAVALGSAVTARADAGKLDPKDPVAVNLHYSADASKVDPKANGTFKAGSNCGNCQFFQGKAGDAWGACPIMAGKLVSAKGWCSAYAKKAG